MIFDVDGTLSETERDGHRVAFNQAFQAIGLDWHWDVADYGQLLAVSGGKERIYHYIQSHESEMPAVSDREAFVQDIHALKTQRYIALLKAGEIGLRPGVERVLREARQAGVRLAIATTTTAENVRVLLECNLGPDSPEWFDEIGAGDVVDRKKPAPDIYRYVCARLGVEPRGCLAIEDSRNGLRSARAAGLPVLVTPGCYTRGEDFTGALAVVDGFGTPDAASTVLSGPPLRGPVVDLAFLRELWASARARITFAPPSRPSPPASR